MEIELVEVPISALTTHASISIAFEVDRILEIETRGHEFVLSERQLEISYTKDYDSIPGEGPASWPKRFDVSNWGLIEARVDDRTVGGAVIASDTGDQAVLWDIRVVPELRRQGIGAGLFRAAETWAIKRGCRRLTVETQNINAGACRFYARQGFTLREINRLAYPELPGEIQMTWYKDYLPPSFF